MTWEQIKEMAESNIFFGSHTLSYPKLTELTAKEKKEEIELSKNSIEKKINCEVKYLCYPYSQCDSEVISIAKQSGYSQGFITPYGYFWKDPDKKFNIHRMGIYANTNFFKFFIKTTKLFAIIK